MNTPAATYRVETGSLAQRETLLEVWHGRLSDERSMADKFDWFYRDSPLGPPLICLLHHEPDTAVVGAATAGPRRMLWHGREIRAGLLVDFAVADSHRSAGPALMLARGVIAHGRTRFDLLYGFPNLRAAAITRRAGHTQLASMHRYARVLRYASYLHRALPGPVARIAGFCLDHLAQLRRHLRRLTGPRLHSAWADRADARFDTLWQHSEHGDALMQVRDTAMAHWRFDACPLDQFRYLTLADPESRTLQAWFATSAKGSVLQVLDFWSVDAAQGIHLRFIDALLIAACREGFSSVSFEYAGAPYKTLGWRRAGFVAREARPVYGSASDIDTSEGLDVHLTAADEDQ